jgi:hypothetical protein
MVSTELKYASGFTGKRLVSITSVIWTFMSRQSRLRMGPELGLGPVGASNIQDPSS